MADDEEIGEAEFKARLMATGLTVEEISKACGVSKPTVERWLSGAVVPHSIMRPVTLGILAPIVAERKRTEIDAAAYREHLRWAREHRKDDPRYKERKLLAELKRKYGDDETVEKLEIKKGNVVALLPAGKKG